MIAGGMAKKLVGGAAGVVAFAADVARHVAWYVSYQVHGRPRDGGGD